MNEGRDYVYCSGQAPDSDIIHVYVSVHVIVGSLVGIIDRDHEAIYM